MPRVYGALFIVLTAISLAGCPAPIDPPATVNRGSGVEVVSSLTVCSIKVDGDATQHSEGSLVQRALVKWLNENPDVEIQNMDVVGPNGHPREIVLIVKGELAHKCDTCPECGQTKPSEK
jgi:hypothetical protein